MSKAKYRIGTRGSKLALAQTQQVIDLLRSFEPEAEFSIEVITTRGEVEDKKPLTEIGGTGVFTAELEHALLKNHVDIAVHSAKDLPTEIPIGLTIAAFTARIDPREALISQHHERLIHLPQGAIIGTSSPRRQFQLTRLRGDLKFVPFRGNVDTRLKKVRSGEVAGTVMACAGLIRLGLMHEASEIFPLDLILPAAGQAALALQCRHDDLRCFRLLELANHQPTAWSVLAERAVLKDLKAGCAWPLGVLASFPYGLSSRGARKMHLQVVLQDPKSGQVKKAETWGSPRRWHFLAEEVSKDLGKPYK
jgi:hydroxymethylbilane synthase